MNKVLYRLTRGAKALARPLVGTVTGVLTEARVAALTFDDGPDATYTPRLLSLLELHGARATFFMVGAGAVRHPALVERVAAAGHVIGNHTWDHPSFVRISSRERRRQVRACADALTPHGSRLFRSPGGHQTPRSVLDIRSLGFDVIGWNIDPRDYADRSADELAEHVLQELRPGSIILLHDAIFHQPGNDRTRTIEAVATILERAAGSRDFVTVPELFRHGRRRRINAFWQPDTAQW
jgi:peptidoglycan-N-acetylglucosamine deacetylase